MAIDRTSVTWLDYQPAGPGFDVEIFPFSDLRRRAAPAQIRAVHRYAFHMLVCVTRGEVTQLVDFLPVACGQGSLLVLRPGQVHSFGTHEGWDGWMVLFRPEFLPPEAQAGADLLPVFGLDRLPDHVSLPASDFAVIAEAIARMQQDATCEAPKRSLHTLLRYQLCALLSRLTILHDRQAAAEVVQSYRLRRFAKFRRLVEQNYAGWHRVASYARALGCTEKSLTRAASEACGQSAKKVITGRIVLEAKRLLAQTDEPVHVIADGLGFVEATNFAKVFKRETGLAPVGFRRTYRT